MGSINNLKRVDCSVLSLIGGVEGSVISLLRFMKTLRVHYHCVNTEASSTGDVPRYMNEFCASIFCYCWLENCHIDCDY